MAPDNTHENCRADGPRNGRARTGGMSLALAIAYLLSASLIIAAARGDLWLDEVWSVGIASFMRSPWEAVTRLTHDNNHILNTLFLYLIGQHDAPILHRLLAIASGIGSLFLLGSIARRRGEWERLFAVLLAGTSFPLVLYFSEARGYAPAIFFSLLAYRSLGEWAMRVKTWRLIAFWGIAVLGLLSHFTFVITLFSLPFMTAARGLRACASLKERAVRTGLFFAVPFILAVLYYYFIIRHMVPGGMHEYGRWNVTAQVAVYALGFPSGTFFEIAGPAFLFGIAAAGTWMLRREGNEQCLFFPVMLVAAPAVLLLMPQHRFMFIRLFVVCFPFFYLLLSSLLGRMRRSSERYLRWAASCIVLLLIIGQAQRLVPLLRWGRGGYRSALSYMADNTVTKEIRIGSDHDFRNRLLLTYYSRFLSRDRALRYIEQKEWKRESPEWIITHSQEPNYRPQGSLAFDDVGKYTFIRAYRSAELSGFNWYIYRRSGDVR